MNHKKGFKRIVIVVSLIPVLFGIFVFVGGIEGGDGDLYFLGGLFTALGGFAAVWAVYWLILYIVKGFKEQAAIGGPSSTKIRMNPSGWRADSD